MHSTLALLDNIGGGEMLLVAVIALLLFGRNLPSVSRKVGSIVAEFKKGVNEASSAIRQEMDSAADAIEDAERTARADLPAPSTSTSSSATPTATPSTATDSETVPTATATPLDQISAGSTDAEPAVARRRPRAQPAVNSAAALDRLDPDPPVPKRIPPPLDK